MEHKAKGYEFSKEYTRGTISVNISLRASEETAESILSEFASHSHKFYLDMAEELFSNKR